MWISKKNLANIQCESENQGYQRGYESGKKIQATHTFLQKTVAKIDEERWLSSKQSEASLVNKQAELNNALLQCIEAFAPNYGEDVDKFVADMAIWKDSIERQRALERLNGLDAETLTKLFDIQDEDDDGDR